MRRPFWLGLSLLAAAAGSAELLPPTPLAPPPLAVTLDGRSVVYQADGCRYESLDEGGAWEVRSGGEPPPLEPLLRARRAYVDTNGTETIFQSELGRDGARLLIRRFAGHRVEPVADLVLYDRWIVREAMGRKRGRKFLLAAEDTLEAAPKPAPALFSEIRRAGNSLWLGVGWEAGATRGVGALIRHELDTGETRVFRPFALENLCAARLSLTPDAVWVAAADTVRGVFGTRVLVRFDPRLEEAEVMPSLLDRESDEIRVLETKGDTLWLGTEGALHRATEEGAVWSTWRLRSTVRVARREEISSLPGRPSRRAIPSGTYFVLAMTADSLLIETDDGVEGWLAPDSLRRDPIALREGPDAGSPAVGLFPDASALDPLPLRTPDGWQKARARAGWLLRSGRNPRPVVGSEVQVPGPGT